MDTITSYCQCQIYQDDTDSSSDEIEEYPSEQEYWLINNVDKVLDIYDDLVEEIFWFKSISSSDFLDLIYYHLFEPNKLVKVKKMMCSVEYYEINRIYNILSEYKIPINKIEDFLIM